MDSNTILYSPQVDTSKVSVVGDTLIAKTDTNIYSADSASKFTTKRMAEPKFKEYDYQYHVSVIPASDSMFMPKDTIDSSTKKYEKISLDSIFKASTIEPFQHKSLFESHEHQSKSWLEKERESNYYPSWVFGILFAVVLIMSWNFNVNRVYIQKIFMACFGRRNLNLLFHDGDILRERIIIVLMFSFITTLSLAVYGFFDIYDYNLFQYSSFLNFLVILLAVVLFILLKQSVIRFLGNVFRAKNETTLYLTNTVCYYFLETMLLLPLLFFLFYVDSFYTHIVLIIVLILLPIMVLLRLTKGLVMILLDSKFSQLHFFSYLCTIELIPVLVLIKLVFF